MNNSSADFGRLDLLTEAMRIVARAEQCSLDDALARITSRAKNEGRTVEEIAKAVTDDPSQ